MKKTYDDTNLVRAMGHATKAIARTMNESRPQLAKAFNLNEREASIAIVVALILNVKLGVDVCLGLPLDDVAELETKIRQVLKDKEAELEVISNG